MLISEGDAAGGSRANTGDDVYVCDDGAVVRSGHRKHLGASVDGFRGCEQLKPSTETKRYLQAQIKLKLFVTVVALCGNRFV